ncbi:cytochrome P450, partial [Bipolaris maydis]
PGPFWARYSPIWLVLQCRRARRSVAVMQQHKIHGDFVLIAPNHVSINNLEAVNTIYGHKSGFVKSGFYDAFLQVTPVVFNVRDPDAHQRKRKFLNPAFSAKALSDFEPHMNTELLAWKKRLLEMVKGGSASVDFVTWTNYLAFDVIGRFAFGSSFGFIEKGMDPYNLIATIDTRGEVLNALGSLPSWIRPWMKYNYLDPFWSAGLRARANLESIGRAAYQRRKNHNHPEKDLLSFLFHAKDDNGSIEEQEIIAESISFIVGGSDTTSSTITNFIDFVSRDPALQKELQAELDKAFPGRQNGDWVAPDDVVQHLPLLVATLREVLRIRPTSATGLERIVPEGGRTIAGVFFPAGTIVSVPTCGLLSNERVFEAPEMFRPQRWMTDDAKDMMAYFLPFSTGPRACIGRRFAWMDILKAVAVLFKLFDTERVNKKPTIIREGFFNKTSECECVIRLRHEGTLTEKELE